MNALCKVRRCGRLDYERGLEMQNELVTALQQGGDEETFLLVEHPHVLTLGRNFQSENILLSDDELARRGIQRFEVGRGGDVTYHGPGQLVGYPVLKLGEGERDTHEYLRRLEEVLIRTLASFGISAFRKAPHTGAWVEVDGREKKIAAIGVRLAKWVVSHGFALNVDCDLSYFETIIPCGISEYEVTSMQECLGEDVQMDEVIDRLLPHFGAVMGRVVEEV